MLTPGRPLVIGLAGAGLALGVVGEIVAYDSGELALAAADLAAGLTLVGCGLVAWHRRPESRVGGHMSLAGFTWFLGNLVPAALFLHRGPLVHLHLSYPTGRVTARLAGAVVVAAYVYAVLEPVARNDVATLVLAAAVALTAIRVFLGTSGPARKAAEPALVTALAFAGVLAAGAVERMEGWNADRAVLLAYDGVIAAIALVLLVDLIRGRWADAVVTGLVVDLGTPETSGGLRDRLAHALGDRSLAFGYRLPGSTGLVDEAGRPVELPAPGTGRAVTPIEEHGEQIAVLVHDDEIAADRELVDAVAAAARIAVGNARLQAEVRARAVELEASRRRIVEAADEQRRRLEQELRHGAERRLEVAAAFLHEAGSLAAGSGAEPLEAELDEARRELRAFAHGVHPAALTDDGLVPAVERLRERSAIPVDVRGAVGRLPGPIEAALFFVASEALANAAKHASCSHVAIELRQEPENVVVEIADDGHGGADPAEGSGLRGLADRVEALGGGLRVESPPGAGTRVVARVPLGRG
jgi:signal transduction histidine kinase